MGKILRGRGGIMEIDLKKLDTAILYLQRIADGNNPVNNMPAEDDSVLNNPNVIRCMFFVKDVLEEVRRNDGFIGRKPKKSEKADFPVGVLSSFVYQEDKPITRFVEQINELIDENHYQKLSYKPIQQWLKLNGFIAEEMNEEMGKTVTAATEKGMKIGIRSERRLSMRGVPYMASIYSKSAQEYIVGKLERILNGEVDE